MSACFYCGLENQAAHPRCDTPGCDNKVHGFGPTAKPTLATCPTCRGVNDPRVMS